MRTKALKIILIAVVLVPLAIVTNSLQHGENNLISIPVLAIIAAALLAFIFAVWKWKPKNNNSPLKKD
jgi:uncharacterized membrane protein YoaK (UPF0700 family)